VYKALTSPPAQKALPPAPYIQKALFLWISGREEEISLIICKLREFKAFGLLSTIFKNESFSTKSMFPTVLVDEKLLILDIFLQTNLSIQ